MEGRICRIHWHWNEKRYSVSVRASNGRWYVVRRRETGGQLFFGKLVLHNARFVVQPAGAKKAYETGKRNVHASVVGTVKRAQFPREKAVVPCGTPVMYSHNLYPEPEFKALVDSFGYQERRMVPIFAAEMLACGTDPQTRKPNMLAAGYTQLYTEDF